MSRIPIQQFAKVRRYKLERSRLLSRAQVARARAIPARNPKWSSAWWMSRVNRDSRSGITIASPPLARSFVRSFHRGGKSNKKRAGERNPTRSSSACQKAGRGGGGVPYLLCRCRVAINSPEFTAVEKRHTANIIHRTRPVIR